MPYHLVIKFDYNNTVYYDYGVLDKDNNGTIDSITIIYKNNGAGNISVSWSSPLWNYLFKDEDDRVFDIIFI